METKELVDIKDVHINTALPREQRIKDYLKQIKNPYKFLVNDITVTVTFSENTKDFNKLLKNVVKNKII